MRVLVACECSGTVRRAFRGRGHDAYSCDLKASEDSSPYHLIGDVRPLLGHNWDLMIAHPDCTYLTVANTYMNRGCSKYTAEQAKEYRAQAVAFFMLMADAPIPLIAIENPIGIMSSCWRKPDQIIQPWMYGEDASKSTCLWLKGLPLLTHTKVVPPRQWKQVKYAADLPLCKCCDEPWCSECKQHFYECDCIGPTQDGVTYKTICGYDFGCIGDGQVSKPVWSNQTPSGQNKLGPSPQRAVERARTYTGIAEAMASQWTSCLTPK